MRKSYLRLENTRKRIVTCKCEGDISEGGLSVVDEIAKAAIDVHLKPPESCRSLAGKLHLSPSILRPPWLVLHDADQPPVDVGAALVRPRIHAVLGQLVVGFSNQ